MRRTMKVAGLAIGLLLVTQIGVLAGYIDNGNGTVTDTSTGLMWQKETPDSWKSWEGALSYCENLTLGGHTDWRLPTIKELHSLIDYSRYNPAINTTFFPDTVASNYWSSTTNPDYSNRPWFVLFSDGSNGYNYKSYYYYVRAVRGGQAGSFDYSCYLDISAIGSPQQVGESFPVTITAKDGYGGNTNSGFNGSVNLSSSAGDRTVSPYLIQMENGQWSGNVTLLAQGDNIVLSASSGALSGASNAFSVNGTGSGRGNVQGAILDYYIQKVTDEVTVKLTGPETHEATFSGGAYQFTNIKSGTYELTATRLSNGLLYQYSNLYVPQDFCWQFPIEFGAVGSGTKRPVLLVPGIMGSTWKSNEDTFPVPKLPPNQNCEHSKLKLLNTKGD